MSMTIKQTHPAAKIEFSPSNKNLKQNAFEWCIKKRF
ncbi:hypothetical protein GNIT_1983 [Glaciecola nitratireducens FR1064]|uniref:Uncharacterized protein n=1 Tax=Glaciecola nitratireducens (strain JCM 12485 / KCTC 12276 / FR1064) TaxID=1085623 RepID=G4QKM6_GLANF|nr:hypothetical protein GNIT_1983 [Glaciecola nitratireducens FR1064]